MKTCQNCGKELVKRKWDRGARWERRTFCNQACKSQFLIKQKPTKSCVVCGKEMHRSEDNRSDALWEKRMACSPQCSGLLRRTPLPIGPRFCLNCGKGLTQGPHESVAHFAKRKTCGVQCIGIFNKQRAVTKKRCVTCGRSFVRGDDETAPAFRSRKTCGDVCRWESFRENYPKSAAPPRTCVICGGIFELRKGEIVAKFNKKQTCGRKCGRVIGAEKRRIEMGTRYCVVCGVGFERRADELTTSFSRRKTCSFECHHIAIGQARRGVISATPAPYPREFYELREVIYERDGQSCALCGETHGKRRLAIHHINYIKADCRPANLISLCMSCHGKTQHGSRGEWVERFRRIVVARESLAA